MKKKHPAEYVIDDALRCGMSPTVVERCAMNSSPRRAFLFSSVDAR